MGAHQNLSAIFLARISISAKLSQIDDPPGKSGQESKGPCQEFWIPTPRSVWLHFSFQSRPSCAGAHPMTHENVVLPSAAIIGAGIGIAFGV
jgi:hypothetical protein